MIGYTQSPFEVCEIAVKIKVSPPQACRGRSRIVVCPDAYLCLVVLKEIMDRRRVLTIFLIVFVNFLGASIVQPILPLYAGGRFGASPGTISILLASYFAAQFLAAPVLGQLSDRYGRLPVLVLSQVGTVASFLILAGAESLPMLFAGRILDGITGGNVIVAQAYLTDISTPKQRAGALGVVFMAFGLGYALGPAVGGFISALADDRTAYYVAAGISLVTVLMTIFLLDESLTPAQRLARRLNSQSKLGAHDVVNNPSLMVIMALGFVAQLSIALMNSTLALYGEQVIFAGQPSDNVHLGNGLIFSGFGIGQVIAQLFLLRPLIARYGEKWLIVFGAVFRGLSIMSIVLIVSPFWVAGVAMPLVAISSGVMMPSVQTLATTSVSRSVSGAALGWYQSAATMGIILGTALGGQFFSIAPALPYLIAGGILLLTTIPALYLKRIHKPYIEPEPDISPATVAV